MLKRTGLVLCSFFGIGAFALAQNPPPALPASPPTAECQAVYARFTGELERGIRAETQAIDLQRELQKVRTELVQAKADLAKAKEKAAPEGAASPAK